MNGQPESLVPLSKKILSDLEKQDRDLFLYSGSIDQKSVNDFFLAVLTRQEKKPLEYLIDSDNLGRRCTSGL